MARIRLLSTDFDGTLIGHGSDGRCAPALAAALREHAGEGGLWAVNTGRGLEHTIAGLQTFDPPVWPDFLLTHERHVFRRHENGSWDAHGGWNDTCRRRHEELFDAARAVFGTMEKLTERLEGVTLLYEEENPAGLLTATEELMDEVIVHLEREAAEIPDFGYQRNTIYLRFCHRDYHKGSALGELCRLENIAAGEVLAVGDHCNDLSMLDGSYAGMPACPGNAIDQVKELVRRAGGYVAKEDCADGVVEAMRHYQKKGGIWPTPESRLEKMVDQAFFKR